MLLSLYFDVNNISESHNYYWSNLQSRTDACSAAVAVKLKNPVNKRAHLTPEFSIVAFNSETIIIRFLNNIIIIYYRSRTILTHAIFNITRKMLFLRSNCVRNRKIDNFEKVHIRMRVRVIWTARVSSLTFEN